MMWLAIRAGTPGQCSATACIDLSKYPFMNSNSCICNSPALGQIANSAGSAVRHYMRAAIGEAPAQHPLPLQGSPWSALTLWFCIVQRGVAKACTWVPGTSAGIERRSGTGLIGHHLR